MSPTLYAREVAKDIGPSQQRRGHSQIKLGWQTAHRSAVTSTHDKHVNQPVLKPQNMTRHDHFILKSLKHRNKTAEVYQNIYLQEKSSIILCLNWSQCGEGYFCPNITVNLNQSFLSTLAPAQTTERNIAICFPYNGGGKGGGQGGARPHFNPPSSKPILSN